LNRFWTRAIVFGGIALLVVVVGTFVLLRRHTPATPTSAGAAIAIAPVAVIPARRHDLEKRVTIVAELRPWNTAALYAKQSGYLRSIYVDYGSRVSAGETVATLELPEQQAAYMQAEAAFRLASSDYNRILSVVRAEPGLLAAVDVDKAQAAFEEAKAARDQDAVLLGYANITAPFDGVVTKRYVDPGALIQAGTSTGTQPIVQIADDYRLRLVIEVPEDIVARIHVGMPVDIKIQSTGKVTTGTVARYSYDVHEDTRTMHTEIDITNADLALKPGMYASATITVERRNDVLAVPPQTISSAGAQSNVWVVDANDRIEQRPVTTGLQTPDWVEITGGLHLGDRVFLGDRSTIAVGDRVQPKVVAPVGS
jgi:RND family efflux transporter MFP subunit